LNKDEANAVTFAKKYPMPSQVTFYKKFIGQVIRTAPSPLSNWLAGTIREVEESHLVIEFSIREEMCNPVKVLHGGMIAAMMDDVIGMHLFVIGTEPFHVSVSLHVDFIQTAPLGAVISVKSELIRKGSRLVTAQCTITESQTHRLLARGSAQLIPS
jgi:acyl-coenzyme A thioesterase 13